MAFDAARGRMVMFGGRSGSVQLRDTWEWDGTRWLQRFPANAPSGRNQHAMAYDAARQCVVLHGGSGIGPVGSSDTWEWHGSDWAQRATPHVTPAQANHALFFDAARNQVVMFGVVDQIWGYDGIDWSPIAPGTAPSPRSGSAMCDDPQRGEVVLFGGAASSSTYGDTWTWGGQRWSKKTPGTAPSPRSGHALAFDPVRGTAVLFGGYFYGGPHFDETWIWDGASWQQMQTANRPSARVGAGLAWHAPSQHVVLFGGGRSQTMFQDTWTWDGVGWTQLTPASSPPARSSAAMSAMGQEVVLFGGFTRTTSPNTGTYLDDTWRWDGSNWSQLHLSVRPSARSAGSTYDASRGRMLVLGGYPTPSSASVGEDVWAFDGTNWSPLSTPTTPLVRSSACLAYDSRRREVVMYGGTRSSSQDDTWVLGAAGTQGTFGVGCPGSSGTPGLQVAPESLPEPGGAVVVGIVNLPQPLAAMVMGFSNTTTGVQALPMALAPFGMPGCDLLVATDAAVLVLGSAGAGRWTLPLPAAAAMVGIEFYYQAFAYDPPANVAGFVTSAGGSCRIGY
ncbi:MAG: hypothetical protein JNK49_07125 [Planctomycetes bacterium]|nr:hypothetical protein [Planctomycetota bacterium]